MPNKLIKANDGSLIGNSFFIVGSVQQTFLSAVEFESIMGTEWVLADGRDVTGSLYETVTGSSTVPDCRGMFLRTVGGDADPAIGGTQAFTTSASGLSTANDSHSHTGAGSMGILNAQRWDGTGLTYNFVRSTPNAGSTITTSDTHNHTISGASETRPVNITVNTYIKIN